MKNLLLIILLFKILGNNLFAHEEMNWAIAIADIEGKPLSIRFRQEVPAGIDLNDYPYLVIIIWEYLPENESGFPAPEINEFMGEFENSFYDAIEGNAYLMMAFLGNGTREWQIYTKDVAKFKADLKIATKKFDYISLKLSEQKDLGWKTYFELRPIQTPQLNRATK